MIFLRVYCETTISFSVQTISLQELQKDFESTAPTDTNNNQTAANGTNISYVAFNPSVNTSRQANTSSAQGSMTSLRSSTCGNNPSSNADPMTTAPPFVHFHTIILDMSGVCFVDLMGTKALGKVSLYLASSLVCFADLVLLIETMF